VRVAWFSPLPPNPSGIASYSADVLALLDDGETRIDRFVDAPVAVRSLQTIADGDRKLFNAHDFVWKHQRDSYDLIVYQLGNARWHDYMWAYMVSYPGLVVLHDTRVHHARARQLLNQGRPDDYRREFRSNHPDAPAGVEEYAVEGLSGSLYYFWSMLPVVLRTARLVAVHNPRVALDVSDEHAGLRVATIRMGVAPWLVPDQPADEIRTRIRRHLGISDQASVFVSFGHVTAEKRIETILRALARLVADGTDAHLILVGPPEGLPALGTLLDGLRLARRVHVTGYAIAESVAGYFAAADACLCLRWPTAGETSASWLRSIAAGRPTVLTGLAQLSDVPTIDAGTWRPSHASAPPIAITVDLLDEDDALLSAMSRLAVDAPLRADLASAAHAYWSREHTLEVMADDYRRVMREAAARAAPRGGDLPAHFTDNYSTLVQRIAEEMGVRTDGRERPR
jgi:glycosyltransferase involved in cell wall biosynthesis